MPEIPYQDDQVVEVLIADAPDWTPIKRGSLRAMKVGTGDWGGEPITRDGIEVIDQMDGKHIFFFADRLAAVKYIFDDEENTTGIPTADGRLLP